VPVEADNAAVTLRDATPADAPAIAALHVAVSRATYAHLAPPEASARLNYDHRLARWRETLTGGKRHVLVAEADNRIIATGSVGAPTVPEMGGRAEILHLYVAGDFAGRGLGRRLMQALAARAQADDYPGIALGVVEGNAGAVAFYERLAGRCIGRYTDPGPIWRSENLIYVWDDLAPLLSPALAHP
jgi:ribosomal protein S18 acetylase RimI-like enzyme